MCEKRVQSSAQPTIGGYLKHNDTNGLLSSLKKKKKQNPQRFSEYDLFARMSRDDVIATVMNIGHGVRAASGSIHLECIYNLEVLKCIVSL